MTIGRLRTFLDDHDIPDDAEVWIEYPTRYGLAQPECILRNYGGEDQDFIECLTLGHDKDKKRFFFFHHY